MFTGHRLSASYQQLLLMDLYRTSVSNDASWATRLSTVAQSRPQLYRDIIVTGDTVPGNMVSEVG